MDDQEKLYKNGFNSGYLLAQHEPELAAKILDSVRGQNNEYCSGLSVGHDTYVMEKIIEQNKGRNKAGKSKPDKGKEDRER